MSVSWSGGLSSRIACSTITTMAITRIDTERTETSASP